MDEQTLNQLIRDAFRDNGNHRELHSVLYELHLLLLMQLEAHRMAAETQADYDELDGDPGRFWLANHPFLYAASRLVNDLLGELEGNISDVHADAPTPSKYDLTTDAVRQALVNRLNDRTQ